MVYPQTHVRTPPAEGLSEEEVKLYEEAAAVMLQAKSRHRDLRTLSVYTRPGVERRSGPGNLGPFPPT